MQSLLQSAFLQALGYAIFNSLWQVALLWIVAMIVNSVGKFSSSQKYYTGIAAQLAGFIWFLFTLKFYYTQCSKVIANAQIADITNTGYYFYEPVVNNFSSGLIYGIIKVEQLLPYLSVAYLFMLLFLAVRLVRAYVYTKKIRTTGLVKPGVEWKLFVKRTAGYLGIHKNVTLYFSDLVKTPLTLGFVKPLILIPVASLNHLSADQLEAILLHELAHIKRADYLINIIQSIIEITLFFNPFTQLLGKLIKKERENSCDDWVLQFQYQPAMYAEALLRIAYIQTQPSFALQAASGNKGELLPRVKRMLNQQEKTHQYRNHVFALLLITIMLTTVAWFNPSANKRTSDATASNNNKVLVEPFTSSVANPLYNPFYLITKPLLTEVSSAINIAAAKVAGVIPTTEHLIKNVTPIALESLDEAYNNLEKELPGVQQEVTKAIQGAKLELENIKIDGISIKDSVKLSVVLNNIVQQELSKLDWTKVNADMEKANFELTNWQDETEKSLGKEEINEVLQHVSGKLKLLNDKKNAFDAQGLLKSLFEQKQKDATKQQQQKAKEQKGKNNRITSVLRTKAPLQVWSDMKRDDYLFELNEDAVAAIASTYKAEEPMPAYAPAAYSERNINNDKNIVPDSAVIIVQHNPDNDKSHTKNITIQIVGNDGTLKTYTVTVDVYQ
ncbi:hypothetical protein BH10BAC2_BH10BAC2_24140 [soil metagenome]